MSVSKRIAYFAAIVGLAAVAVAMAQISTINSAVYATRQFNDIPAATLNVVETYPSLISFEEQNVSKPSGFANRDSWHFSNNNATPFFFGNNDQFTATMTVTLTADPTISPRREAGFV